MRITADTNILLRAILDDHPRQSSIAKAALLDAELIAISLPTLCELVWVLRKCEKRSARETALLVRELLSIPSVSTNNPAAEAGLMVLEDSGDFADGVIAFEGRRLGGEAFVTFDREAAKLVQRAGQADRLLSSD